MASNSGSLQRADQIASRFFAKFALVVDNARNISSEPREDTRTDKWVCGPCTKYSHLIHGDGSATTSCPVDRTEGGSGILDEVFNLETPDSDMSKDLIRVYKSISQLGASPPPLELQVLLTVPELTDKQVLVQHPPNASRMRVEPTPSNVLLESWALTFIGTTSESPSSSSQSSASEVTLATVYKHIMSIIRSLYTLLRVLPAWKICKRLRRRPGAGARNGHLGLMLRVRARGIDASTSEDMRCLAFDEPLSPSSPALPTATHTFDPITHPMGVFSAAVTYLTSPHFELDTVEALLSSRFLSLDAGPEFTPTLARNSQRESMSGSPGSLPMRTSLPHSPPGDRTDRDKIGRGMGLGAGTTSSIADRFVFPKDAPASGSRTSLPSTSPRARAAPLPPAGQVQRSVSAQQPQTGVGTGSAGSIGSSSRHSREEGREVLSSIARVRRESTGVGRGSDLPSAPGPVLIRRPSTTVSPFKSSTLSSGSPSLYSNSPSLRHASPLSGPSLPAAPAGRSSTAVPPSPISTRVPGSRGESAAGPSSPITAYRAGSQPVLPLRPSPPTPFAPSSLGERRFPGSPAGSGPSGELVALGTDPVSTPARRQRYSSSFGYRYVAVSSEGSAGSGDKGKEPERPGSASYLSTNTDDDDISAFVQDIDARKPIGGGFNTRHDRERTLSETGLARRALLAGTESPSQIQEDQALEEQEPERAGLARRHSRTVSEGQRGSALAREADTTTRSGEGSGSGQSETPLLSQEAIDERYRALHDAFRASMGLVERRSNVPDESTEPPVPSPLAARPPFPVPGAAHLRTPSFGSVGADRPLSAPRTSRQGSGTEAVPSRRLAATPGGVGSAGENISIWDNRRLRSDSNGSSASGLSELDRARLFYTQGRVAHGSVGSVGGESEEAVGRMSMDRVDL